MSLFPIFDWWGKTAVAHAMNGPVWAFPLVETFHMIGIVLLIGTTAIVDLRLLGLRLMRTPVPEIAKDLKAWTLLGLALMLVTGPLLVSTDPDRYYDSGPYRFKMACLLLAALFDFVAMRRVRSGRRAASPGWQRFAGGMSLVLWCSVVAGGRAIGLFE